MTIPPAPRPSWPANPRSVPVANCVGDPVRPVMMNRPFRSVGEMAYAFRDQPFRTLNFSSASSPDAGLLDRLVLLAELAGQGLVLVLAGGTRRVERREAIGPPGFHRFEHLFLRRRRPFVIPRRRPVRRLPQPGCELSSVENRAPPARRGHSRPSQGVRNPGQRGPKSLRCGSPGDPGRLPRGDRRRGGAGARRAARRPGRTVLPVRRRGPVLRASAIHHRRR